MCICALPVLCTKCMPRARGGQMRASEPLELEVLDSCWPLWILESNLSLLRNHPVLLVSKLHCTNKTLSRQFFYLNELPETRVMRSIRYLVNLV